jgi:hypothetical protein
MAKFGHRFEEGTPEGVVFDKNPFSANGGSANGGDFRRADPVDWFATAVSRYSVNLGMSWIPPMILRTAPSSKFSKPCKKGPLLNCSLSVRLADHPSIR